MKRQTKISLLALELVVLSALGFYIWKANLGQRNISIDHSDLIPYDTQTKTYINSTHGFEFNYEPSYQGAVFKAVEFLPYGNYELTVSLRTKSYGDDVNGEIFRVDVIKMNVQDYLAQMGKMLEEKKETYRSWDSSVETVILGETTGYKIETWAVWSNGALRDKAISYLFEHPKNTNYSLHVNGSKEIMESFRIIKQS